VVITRREPWVAISIQYDSLGSSRVGGPQDRIVLEVCHGCPGDEEVHVGAAGEVEPHADGVRRDGEAVAGHVVRRLEVGRDGA
jgi:hypothetical protein